jgi:hypothetical protein
MDFYPEKRISMFTSAEAQEEERRIHARLDKLATIR